MAHAASWLHMGQRSAADLRVGQAIEWDAKLRTRIAEKPATRHLVDGLPYEVIARNDAGSIFKLRLSAAGAGVDETIELQLSPHDLLVVYERTADAPCADA